jgi:hypothetical protein
MQRFLNHLAEGLIIILDSASYNFAIIDKIQFLTQDLTKTRFLNDFERILNVIPRNHSQVTASCCTI